jgi:Rne/Rng family ribonuclease
MSRELIIEATPFGARAAVLNDGRLSDLKFADRELADIRGQIFLGRVTSVDKTLDAAFVDCGIGQPAYLTARDARPLSDQPRGTPISRLLDEGRAVLVQGKRPSAGSKGARVTADIQIPGVYLVYRPRRSANEISGRLAQSKEADGLRARIAKLFPSGGMTLRSAALDAQDDLLKAEAERLQALWQEVSGKAEKARPPACLFQREDPIERVLQDVLTPRLARIVVGDRTTLARVRGHLETWLPALAERLSCTPKAFEACGIEEQLEQALAAEVALPGGGSLIIEPTAALTAIDVNGGGRAAREVNLAAAEVVARQIRLRRIGGTIVVDFVDLATHRERMELQAALESAFARDPAPVQISPVSAQGLVTISRERLGPSLAERLRRPCPACGGCGQVPTLRHSTERLFAALAVPEAARARIQLRLAVDLYHHLMTEAAAAWRDFAARQGIRPPKLAADETLPPGGFKIDGLPGG